MLTEESTSTLAVEGLAHGGLERTKYLPVAILIAAGIMATGLAQPAVIGNLLFTNILHDELGKNGAQIGWFMLLISTPWFLFRPIFGLVSDAFPLLGTRRRHYLLVTTLLAILGWIAFPWVPHRYETLTAACFALNVFMAFGATVIGGVFVEVGRSMNALNRLTSLRVVVQSAAAVIQGPLGGVIAAAGVGVMVRSNVALLFTLIPITYIFLRERPGAVRNSEPFKDAWKQVNTLCQSRSVWLVLGLFTFFYFAPGFGGTVQTLRQLHLFNLSSNQVGILMGVGGAFGVAIALLFPFFSNRWSLKTLIGVAIPLLAISNFAYLLYSSNMVRDGIIDAQSAVLYIFCDLILYTIAARATPVGCEGMGYALLVGYRDLCIYAGNVVGGLLIVHKMQFWQLIAINSASSICAIVLVPLLPLALTSIKESSRGAPHQPVSTLSTA